MQRVLVLDKSKNPLMPCHLARARQLLKQGKAAVFRQYPFTIVLKERDGGDVQPVTIKVDPGSKTTGIALVSDFKGGKRVIWAGELTHRGQQIRDRLLSRRQLRRGVSGLVVLSISLPLPEQLRVSTIATAPQFTLLTAIFTRKERRFHPLPQG